MRIDKDDLRNIASALDAKLPGFSQALASDHSKLEQKPLQRSSLLEILQGAGAVATIVIALKAITPSINVLLSEVEPGKTPDQIVASLSKTFHEQFVVPARENSAKMKLVVNAVLAYIKARLNE